MLPGALCSSCQFGFLNLPACFVVPAMAQFSPFEVGQVKAHMHHGLGAQRIAAIVLKADGKTHFSITAVQGIMDKLLAKPSWKGERAEGSGAPRKTSDKQDKDLIKYVLKYRGIRKVTVAHLRTQFRFLRGLSNTLVEERLGDADLQWLRRRDKSVVTSKYIPERLAYCEDILTKQQKTLDTWAYTDGVTFYLDRTLEENEHSQRAALGKFVWRKSDCRDAMCQECLGPSSYKKAQGHPVRVWGMLSEGHLYIHVLEAGEVMNEMVYTELIEDHFERWLGSSRYLVQDFERCLRTDGPLLALEQVGVTLVEGYPRVSQDFNAIENVWKTLRERLSATLPLGLEKRDAFIVRLKAAVAWVNRNKRDWLWYLARNQKERCRDCKLLKGGRTTW